MGTVKRGSPPQGSIDLFSTHSDVFLEIWPTSGMWEGGSVFELPTPVLPTADSGSSSLPTPQAHDAMNGKTPEQVAAMRARGHGVANLNEVIFPVLLKTPTSQLAVNGGSQHPDKRKAGGHGPTLADEVEHLLPTPTASVANDGEGTHTWLSRREEAKAKRINGNGMGMPLSIAVQLLGESTDQPSEGGNL